ncbi:DUF262 domain-containing protein [Fibrella sp. WM1]|uniref:DUF262 domain-containing protein n=1 Tax=Fibrella musci TaxID=3242485 RepID=UPI003520FBE0
MTKKTDTVVHLINTLEDKLTKVHTQSLDLSFNELLDMKMSGELNISPEFQRLFRWTEGARSRFIESLLLEMPVPPIYVIEENDGSYMLIDGLQRISSYLHLRGELEAKHLKPPVQIGEKLILSDCDIVPELNGNTWDDLGTALQIKLKRAFVRVEVVRKGSDPKFKYHMFKRLNTGGELLSEQQVRNCTIRLLDPEFNNFIIKLSNYSEFSSCVTQIITYEQILKAFDQELVLRFFAFKNALNNFKHDVADYLTEYMESVSDPENPAQFDYIYEEAVFKKTFTIFEKTLGDKSFGNVNKNSTAINRAFGVYHYEALTIGIQPFLSSIDINDSKQIEKLKDIFNKIKTDTKFVNMVTGGGKNSSGQLKSRVSFVKDVIQDSL